MTLSPLLQVRMTYENIKRMVTIFALRYDGYENMTISE